MIHRSAPLPVLAPLLVLACLAGCGPDARKPTQADLAAYLAQSEPGYLQVGDVKPTYEAVSSLGGKALPPGSWRIKVSYTLHATQELYAPQEGARAMRAAFDLAVRGFEAMRVARIQFAENEAFRLGLIKDGDKAPEPAIPVSVVTHDKQDLDDSVQLLAQPDGTAWKFFQLDAQTLGSDAVGAPLADLKAAAPRTVFVLAGSDEDRTYSLRRQRYLAILAKAADRP